MYAVLQSVGTIPVLKDAWYKTASKDPISLATSAFGRVLVLEELDNIRRCEAHVTTVRFAVVQCRYSTPVNKLLLCEALFAAKCCLKLPVQYHYLLLVICYEFAIVFQCGYSRVFCPFLFDV